MGFRGYSRGRWETAVDNYFQGYFCEWEQTFFDNFQEHLTKKIIIKLQNAIFARQLEYPQREQ